MKTDLYNLIKNRIGNLGGENRSQPWQSASPTLELLIPEGWPENSASIDWCLRKDGNIVDEGQTRQLTELAEMSKTAYVLAWVPVRDVLLTTISMPTQRKSRIEQALPYALEDVLLRDIDTQHFSYTRTENNEVAIAVINKQSIATWLDEFRKYNLPLRAMLPTTLGLPVTDESLTLFNDSQAWLRIDRYTGLLLPAENEEELLGYVRNVVAESAENRKISSVEVYNPEPDTDWDKWHSTLGVEIKSGHQPVLSLLHPANCPLSLMHGAYTIQIRNEKNQANKLRPAIIMAVSGIVLLLTMHIYDAWHLSAQNKQLQKEMLSLYRKTFPDEKVIRDPYLQMQRQYEATVSGSSGSGSFIALLERTTSLLGSSGVYELSTINYKDNKITLNISLQDYAALDLIKNRAADHGLTVEILSANRRENQIAGRIRISET